MHKLWVCFQLIIWFKNCYDWLLFLLVCFYLKEFSPNIYLFIYLFNFISPIRDLISTVQVCHWITHTATGTPLSFDESLKNPQPWQSRLSSIYDSCGLTLEINLCSTDSLVSVLVRKKSRGENGGGVTIQWTALKGLCKGVASFHISLISRYKTERNLISPRGPRKQIGLEIGSSLWINNGPCRFANSI